jgi:acyl-CoA thioester hydrolase
MTEYTREVFYYETDCMRVAHHSNYVRWLEEARLYFFAQAGMPYEVTESRGVLAPVTSVSLRFLRSARFGESFTVRTRMTRYTGAKFSMAYTVVGGGGETLCEGESTHGFVGADFCPVSLKRALPDLHEKMKSTVEP